MRTKHLVRFLNRVAHFDADVELVDVVKINIARGAMHSSGSSSLFEGIDSKQHPRLAARTSSSHNRQIALNHLKATLCASFLKDIYEDVTLYMQAILQSAARHGLDPNRLIGEHKVTFDGNDLLSAGGWPAVVRLVAESVFRRLESQRSTKDLLEKMNAKLNLGIRQATIGRALPYLEIRHLLVHSDGVADERFCTAFPKFGAVQGKKLKLDHSILTKARTAILDLITEFDRQVVLGDVVLKSDLQA